MSYFYCFLLILIIVFIILIIKKLQQKTISYKINGDTVNIIPDFDDKEKSAKLFLQLELTLDNLVKDFYKSNPFSTFAQRLYKRFNKDNIQEIVYNETNKETSFTINKKDIHVCARDPNNDSKLHDINDILFVCIHELAHVGCESIGHTEEFWENFEILLKFSIEKKYYKNKNYCKNPVPYCGIKIDSSPTCNN